MKILVLNGSPKAKSDTMQLTNAFLAGVKKTGDHDIEIIDIIKHDIKPCIGCFECWKRKNGKCIIDDFQNVLLDKMREADCILWSFPLYCCGMPSHVKAVLDRTIPLSKLTASDGDEAIKTKSLSQKRYLVICGSGFPLSNVNFQALKIQCVHMFGKVRMICVPETPLLAVPSAKAYTEPLLKKFTDAGEEFGNRTYLYRETVEGLETPMLPNEEYIKIANAQA